MIETTLTPVVSIGTVISAQSYKSPDVNESLTTELIQQNQVLIQPINTGLIGPVGPQGPEYQGDLRLIYVYFSSQNCRPCH